MMRNSMLKYNPVPDDLLKTLKQRSKYVGEWNRMLAHLEGKIDGELYSAFNNAGPFDSQWFDALKMLYEVTISDG